jgi:hypothetical protein
MFNTNPNIEEIVNNKCNEILNYGYEHMMETNNELIEFINLNYLKNLQYDDTVEDLIRYTIRTILYEGIEYNLKTLIVGILNYAIGSINLIFNYNFDLVNEILALELKRLIRREFNYQIFSNVIQDNELDDVKLILDEDEINKIKTTEYSKLDTDTKNTCTKCTICQDEYHNDNKVRELNCKHVFHLECIDQWLKEYSYKCPQCRQPAGEYKNNL